MQNFESYNFDSNCGERLLSPRESDDSGLGMSPRSELRSEFQGPSPRSVNDDPSICLESTTLQYQVLHYNDGSNELSSAPCNYNIGATCYNQSEIIPVINNRSLRRTVRRSTETLSNSGSLTVRELLTRYRRKREAEAQSRHNQGPFSSQDQQRLLLSHQHSPNAGHSSNPRDYENNPESFHQTFHPNSDPLYSSSFGEIEVCSYATAETSFTNAGSGLQNCPPAYSLGSLTRQRCSFPNNRPDYQPCCSSCNENFQTHAACQSIHNNRASQQYEQLSSFVVGDRTIPEYLLHHPQLIDAVDCDGKAPIHHAIGQGQLDVIIFLIERNACMNLLTAEGENILHLAASQPKRVLMCLLQSLDEALIQKLIQSSSPFRTGFTPLHVAVEKKKLENVTMLLNHGADFTRKARDGRSPLHIAVSNGDVASVEILLHFARAKSSNFVGTCVENQNSFLSEFVSQLDGNCCTPLHISASRLHMSDISEELNHHRIMQLLIDSDANMLARNEEGKTPDELLPAEQNSETISNIHQLFRRCRNKIRLPSMTEMLHTIPNNEDIHQYHEDFQHENN